MHTKCPRIVLIVNGQAENKLIIKMHALHSVTAIYLRCSDNTKDELYTHELKKVSNLLYQYFLNLIKNKGASHQDVARCRSTY
jgi:hypothetical protein